MLGVLLVPIIKCVSFKMDRQLVIDVLRLVKEESNVDNVNSFATELSRNLTIWVDVSVQ